MRYLKYFVLFLLVLPVLAALPPLSPEELEARAAHVVLGKVVGTNSQIVPVKSGLNKVYKLQFVVETVEKGDLSKEKTLEVYCKKTHQRPHGWAGPQGQNSIPKEDEKVRLYLRRSQEGRFELLEPNGWEPVGE